MRKLTALAFLPVVLACAREIRSRNPEYWIELESEHFLLRTDLPEEEARKAIADLEVVRAALLRAGWHNERPSVERTVVIELASAREMQEFARKEIDGFMGLDVFGQPYILVSAEHDIIDQPVVKHELAHVQNEGFLITSPRWVQEGIACYLETLRFDRRKDQVVMGEPARERLEYLRRFPPSNYFTIVNTGDLFWTMSGDQVYAFESDAWLIVHWMVDTQPEKFNAFLQRLAKGENQWVAFSAVFSDLHEAEMRARVGQYLKTGNINLGRVPMPHWNGEIAVRRIPPAEVFALRAELIRHAPGGNSPAERWQISASQLESALAADPGNPRALQLSDGADPKAAAELHPDDWRAWVLLYDRGSQDPMSIEKAVRLAPENPGVLFRLAFVEQKAGKGSLALQHAARAVELAPGRPDVLDALAQIQAANHRCSEALETEQRAIEAFPDSATAGAPAALRTRLREITNHCNQAPAQSSVSQRVLLRPVLKACSGKAPRPESLRDSLVARLTIREDGTVSAVAVSGDASKTLMATFKRYVESCTFEPVLVDGKPTPLETTLEMSTRPH